MEKFLWNENYSVGINSIDEQHKHFFEIANRIIEMSGKGDALKDNLLAALGELGDYAFYHFGTEEGYFDKFGYENAPLHIGSHNSFRNKVDEYLANVKEKTDADFKQLGLETAIFAGDWLQRHILLVDKQYTKFFQEKGVK